MWWMKAHILKFFLSDSLTISGIYQTAWSMQMNNVTEHIYPDCHQQWENKTVIYESHCKIRLNYESRYLFNTEAQKK